MQFLAGFAVILTLAFSLMQCDKTKIPDGVNIAKANTNSPAATNTPEEAPRISLEDAKKDFDGGKVLFIDTRGADQYKPDHIKGAINIPAAEFETRYAEVPKDKKIIAYCS